MTQKLLKLFFSLLIVCALATAALAQKWDAPGIDAAMNDAVKFWQTPGAAIVVIKDDQVIFIKGYGVRDVKTKEAVTPDTVFAIGALALVVFVFTTTIGRSEQTPADR